MAASASADDEEEPVAKGDTASSSSVSNSPSYGEEHARTEAWLDENQEFFLVRVCVHNVQEFLLLKPFRILSLQDYLIRKGQRWMIDNWLLAHAFPAASTSASVGRREEDGEEGEWQGGDHKEGEREEAELRGNDDEATETSPATRSDGTTTLFNCQVRILLFHLQKFIRSEHIWRRRRLFPVRSRFWFRYPRQEDLRPRV